MIRASVALGAMLFALALAVGTGVSQDKKDKVKGQLYDGWKNLGLTKEQISKVYAIQTDYRAKRMMLEEQLKDLKNQEYAAAVKVLTEEQRLQLLKKLGGEAKKDEPKKDGK